MNEQYSSNGWQDPSQDNRSQPSDQPQAPYPPNQQGWQMPPQQPYGSWQPPNPNATEHPPKTPYQWNFSEYEQARTTQPRRKRKGVIVFSIVMAAVVVLSLVSFASVSLYSAYLEQNANSDQSPSNEIQPDPNLPTLSLHDKPAEEMVEVPVGGKLSTEQIVEKVEPSIVAIITYTNYQNYQASGMGSGIILREDGYIVTNSHVVANAMGITVRLYNGNEYEGRIIGSDQQTDLAVVKIEANGLSAAEFGNSDQVKVGEKVLAIGNPQSLEFAGSVTQGIVSGLNRSVVATDQAQTTRYSYDSLIQTDAAINPGNSGGALVNEYGQVIGINSAGISGSYQGMGFAIPSSDAQPIVNDLIQYGRVTGRVMLGIRATTVGEVLARMNNVPTGLRVSSTIEGSDISKKGVVPGDIITKVEGNEIAAEEDLTKVIKGKKPGDLVELEVYRPGRVPSEKGRFFNVTIALMENTGTETQQPQPEENYPPQQQEPPLEEYPTWDDFFDGLFG
ncbi:MAG: trypsin-like serine protease [Anaerotruncus sp.]|jgi:serine protease Do|nr:trypsin-like serine protease [Anaerotruncus sp.]